MNEIKNKTIEIDVELPMLFLSFDSQYKLL
jgi:hypothetical protein